MDGRPFALDFGSVMALAAPLGVDTALLATVLPAVDAAVINALSDDGGTPGVGGEEGTDG